MYRLIFNGPVVNEVERERVGSRAIILENGKLLISLLGTRNQYLTPGGGIEEGESFKEGVIRECAEEAGLKVDAEEPFLVIDEYYYGKHWCNYYSRCTIINKVPTNYDEKEKDLKLLPIWVDEDYLERAFSGTMTYEDCEDRSDETIFAVRNSHFRELLAYRISKGLLDLPPIPKNIEDSLKSVKLEEI